MNSSISWRLYETLMRHTTCDLLHFILIYLQLRDVNWKTLIKTMKHKLDLCVCYKYTAATCPPWPLAPLVVTYSVFSSLLRATEVGSSNLTLLCASPSNAYFPLGSTLMTSFGGYAIYAVPSFAKMKSSRTLVASGNRIRISSFPKRVASSSMILMRA